MARGFLHEGKGSYERPVRDGLVGVDVTVRRSEREMALGIVDPNDSRKIIWLPRSLIKVTGDDDPSRTAHIRMPGWLAKREGLI